MVIESDLARVIPWRIIVHSNSNDRQQRLKFLIYTTLHGLIKSKNLKILIFFSKITHKIQVNEVKVFYR